MTKTDKATIRSAVRSGTRTGKVHPSEARLGRRAEPVLCQVCGALLKGRRWQRPGAAKATDDDLANAVWQTCPACEQVESGRAFGRVVANAAAVADAVPAVRRRVNNVARRAEFTNSQHRIVAVEGRDGVLEILTTSQKLAHRIAHELKKAFGGRTRYAWLDDGRLEARWDARRPPAPA
jgi:NMD protein affecting ribosome stability and mRNA decay